VCNLLVYYLVYFPVIKKNHGPLVGESLRGQMSMSIRIFNVANNGSYYAVEHEKQYCHNDMPGNDLWKRNVWNGLYGNNTS